MNIFEILSNNKDALNLVRQAFPGFNKKEVRIEEFSGPMTLRSYWDEGSKDTWAFINIQNGRVKVVPENGSPYSPHTYKVSKLPLGFILVQDHTGRYDYATIYVNKEEMVKMIPQQTDELSWAEKVVLAATRSLKPSYGGISNYRLYSAKKQTGITEDEWNTAKQSLIIKKLINNSGAITMDGKNAIGRTDLRDLVKPGFTPKW